MSGAVLCSLCLERVVDPIGQIDIDSSEANALNVREILNKYFKEEVGKMAESSTLASPTICRPCWESVFTFHQFYLRVQHAHKTLIHCLQSVKHEELTNSDSSPAKRLRGRPRRKGTPKCSTDETVADVQVKFEQDGANQMQNAKFRLPFIGNNIQLDELKLDDIKSDVLKEELMDGNNIQLDELKVDEIKSDVLEEELVEARYFSSTDSDTSSPKDNLSHSKSEVFQAKQIGGRRSLQALNDDEYIAQRFKLSCCLCDSTQENFRELKKHFRKQHKSDGYVICCGKKLFYRRLLVDHLHFHENPQYFKCSKCGKTLVDRNGLEQHQRLHKSTERRYKCDVCSKSFLRRNALLVHSNTHLQEKNYACPECGKRFSTDFFVTRHVNQAHLKKYAKICDICGKSILKCDLQRHMDEHAGVERPPIRCELCGITVTTSRGLARHTKSMHTNEHTPHACPICSRVSTSRLALQRHIRYMHTMKPKHSCSMCDKVFKRPEQLREHMSTHTGEILYTCSFCPRTFISNANMHSHIKKTHANEWEAKRLQKYNTLPTRTQAEHSVQEKIEANGS